ncbi:hypothetical protein Pfo_002139 [Paulownia fortunei]|nr:hypothetical protein Pfo_002139 [Paulownia fortunei]
MADQLGGRDDVDTNRTAVTEIGNIWRSSFIGGRVQGRRIMPLPLTQLRISLFDENGGDECKGKKVVDVTKLDPQERHFFIHKIIRHIDHDNLSLPYKIRKRLDKLPTIEVRFRNLRVEAECEVDLTRFAGLSSKAAKIGIINDVSGIIRPGRMTLLLGPPGCGKTSLLKALSGNLDKSLKFVPQKTSSYVSQSDLHIPQMTAREILDFSSPCQGVEAEKLIKRENEAKLIPDPDVDTYMKVVPNLMSKSNPATDYILKILGLDICADTLVGNAMRIGISGGQKKRLTTGEMIVGPTRALFLAEISNGLDSSTAYQIVSCLQQQAHITNATVLVWLLQPAPETFDLFDDIILMAEGKISCGFSCPERKGVADFLQEAEDTNLPTALQVISRKDQEQYWHQTGQTYNFISVDMFSRKFQESPYGKNLSKDLSVQFDKPNSHKSAVNFNRYSLSKWSLFKACMSREYLLMKRNAFIYVFKSFQLITIASVAMTVFLRNQMAVDIVHAKYYLGALFYALIILLVDGFPELSLTVERLPVFYKQRGLQFYPAWAYAIPATILKIPLSLLESGLWASLTYYTIGYTPEAGRFFGQVILFFAVHFTSVSLFRFLASIAQTMVATATTAGSLTLICVCLFGGFVIPKPSMPIWLTWGFWVSPLTYGERSCSKRISCSKPLSGNSTIGQEILESCGLNFDRNLLWISVGALFGFAFLFNIGFTLALSFLKQSNAQLKLFTSQNVCSSWISCYYFNEKLAQMEESKNKTLAVAQSSMPLPSTKAEPHKGKMVLPFEPLTVVFQNVHYYVETPPAPFILFQAMKERGFTQKRLQLLCDITGAFRPGVLTALMVVSGAGKTTLLDVLAGRKTSGSMEGEITIGGYPKIQSTFARVLGYCEQTDIHSPQITVEESVIFSAWLRRDPMIDSETKYVWHHWQERICEESP